MLRDIYIDQIYARKQTKAYGMGLGIMLLDEVYPGFPGDLRNPSAYPYPIQYEIMEGLNCRNIGWSKGDDSVLLPPILRAAKKLESLGCRAILAECGFFSYFQPMVAGAVDVPVFMSSLLQIPLIQQVIGPKKSVGIFCATSGNMTPAHLKHVGVAPDSNYHIGALMLECTGFQPFARAIQREVDLPVFSWATLMDYAYSVVAHRDFYGHV